MILDVFVGDLPALYGVAVFAVGPELTAVEVGVAVRAMRAYIMENERSVALGTANVFVHAAEWIAGLVVIKFGDGPDGLPTRVGMAVLARNGNGTVGIGYLGTRRRRGLLRSGCGGTLRILMRQRLRQSRHTEQAQCERDNCDMRPPCRIHGGACFQSANDTTAM